MWHIAKRELYDNLNSLRFALATVLILVLMLTNAVLHVREHPARTQAYHNAAASAVKTLEGRSASLYRLATEGPGDLHKVPSPLRFCAEGDEAFLPTHASGANYVRRIADRTPIGKQARAITRISPTAIVQRLFESFAGTGFERHLQFIENVQRYAREYREFVIDRDRADPESLHVIGIQEGMSQKPVTPEAIPKFKDTLSLSKDFNAAAMDLLLLVLFLAVLMSGAYLAFVRLEI